MCHCNQRHTLTLVKRIAGLWPDGWRGRRTRCSRSGAGALHAGIHVRLVVVADIKHVVIALEHARQAAQPDVRRTSIAALRDNSHFRPPFDLHRGSNSGRNRRRVSEQRMHPGNPPRRLWIRRRKHFQATGRIGNDKLIFELRIAASSV